MDCELAKEREGKRYRDNARESNIETGREEREGKGGKRDSV